MSLKSLALCMALVSACSSYAMQTNTQSQAVSSAGAIGVTIYQATRIPTAPIIAGGCTTLLGMGIVPTAIAATAAYHAYNYYTQPGK